LLKKAINKSPSFLNIKYKVDESHKNYQSAAKANA